MFRCKSRVRDSMMLASDEARVHTGSCVNRRWVMRGAPREQNSSTEIGSGVEREVA
jgi:hypothetical protein